MGEWVSLVKSSVRACVRVRVCVCVCVLSKAQGIYLWSRELLLAKTQRFSQHYPSKYEHKNFAIRLRWGPASGMFLASCGWSLYEMKFVS